ncbi:hypothetical protein EV702DRAFT_1201111 [Suillus placidus]|uniref:Uncharacterized protein n=1 Tax=Suillus placidus TaxID=48579 RepID=A0A9P7CZJ1_9AGAM|nr:hypothetical protein EV702DRAFT_1201111 [Suillus placidus]
MTQSTSGSASSFLAQAQSLSVGQKRVTEDLEECDAKRINMGSGGTNNDRYLSPETMLTEAAEDPDVWRLINEIEDFADPELPLCESPTDAAEDPDFCNFPLRTLLICSWLDNSYGSSPP